MPDRGQGSSAQPLYTHAAASACMGSKPTLLLPSPPPPPPASNPNWVSHYTWVHEAAASDAGKVLSRDLTQQLNSAIQFLVQCRPLSISMGNAIKYLKLQVGVACP